MTDNIEPIGKRIARLRQLLGWTQQALAERIAVSRVAISHIEMDLTLPGERTITLMAGVFKMSPHDLIKDTTYPHTKSERLPPITCCHTDLDLDLSLIKSDLVWLRRLKDEHVPHNTYQRWRHTVWERWQTQLSLWEDSFLEDGEKKSLAEVRQALKEACLD